MADENLMRRIILTLSAAWALLCPQSIHCGNLNTISMASNASCALLKPPYVTVSISGCDYTDEYSFCSFVEMMDMYLTVKQGSEIMMNCSFYNTTAIHEEFQARSDELKANADVYMKMRLKAGSHPKLCDSDLDCELLDGSYARCICSTFGKAFCAMSLGDQFMLPFYTMESKISTDYFLSQMRAFPYLNSKLSCSALFLEHELVMEAENEILAAKPPQIYSTSRTVALFSLYFWSIS